MAARITIDRELFEKLHKLVLLSTNFGVEKSLRPAMNMEEFNELANDCFNGIEDILEAEQTESN